MGLFDRFSSNRGTVKKKTAESESLSGYTGMRVEVFDYTGQMLFVAALFIRAGGEGELRQFSNAAPMKAEEPIAVTMRGYDERQRMAIHFRGVISPLEARIWKISSLTLTGKDNDRAFFRQATNAAGEVVLLGWVGVQNARPCEIRNVSAGGVCLQANELYQIGSKLQIRFELIRGRELPALRCVVLRVVEKKKGLFEYGCRFVDMPKGAEDQIAKAIMDLQMMYAKR